ncbi:MAG: hypothetical protein ACLR2P_11575 [Bilophila wadsworthia]
MDTLYVIGGLYGNLPALKKVLEMAGREPVKPVLVFNGDFNWFNIDDAGFESVNRLVLEHDATLGNVEAELCAADDLVGCGCAYPSSVGTALVERSNLIHALLRKTAARHRDILMRLADLPLYRRYRVGDCKICVLHGDSESLAGWGVDESALRDPKREEWLRRQFELAKTDVFSSSHTCLPVLRPLSCAGGDFFVINNGAAGMPNFRNRLHGIITRISNVQSPFQPLYGKKRHDIHIDALAVPYDQERWKVIFLANWRGGSPAYVSYFHRICEGTSYEVNEAVV